VFGCRGRRGSPSTSGRCDCPSARFSLGAFSDFTGASFDAEGIRVFKETAAFDKPFVRKSAFVGTENFPHGLSEKLSNFSRREFPAFKTRDEALAWLAKD
jgi:hypothetical protein